MDIRVSQSRTNHGLMLATAALAGLALSIEDPGPFHADGHRNPHQRPRRRRGGGRKPSERRNKSRLLIRAIQSENRRKNATRPAHAKLTTNPKKLRRSLRKAA